MPEIISITLLCLAPILSTAQSTQSPDDAAPMQSVSVSAVKDPEIRSYRSMLAGLVAFEKNHSLAPAAPELRFVLSPMLKDSVADYRHAKLSIRGDTVSIPVPIDTDNSFAIPRSKEAEDENADLILDLRKGEIRGRPDIRTPGVPENTRRLGDLRLECEVRSAIAKAETNFVFRSAIAAATLGRGLCQSAKMKMGFFAGRKIQEVTLVAGDRHEPLTRFSGPHYFPPVGDKDWPDDTLIHFKFEDASAPKASEE